MADKKVADKKVEETATEVVEPVYVRDWRKKVFNTLNGETFELDEDTAEMFAQNPSFYDAVWDPNMQKSVSVSLLRWEGPDGQKVGS